MATPPILAPAPRRGARSVHPPGAVVALVVTGAILALVAVALLAAGGAGVWLNGQRNSAGYVDTDFATYSTGTYALVSDGYRGGTSRELVMPADVLGTV